MKVTERLIEAVPAGNLRAQRTEFAHVWRTAERLNSEYGRKGLDEWYPAGVAVTCRWLAGAVVTDQVGRRAPAPAPVTRRRDRAFEELIDAELLAAEALPRRDPAMDRRRPDWVAAITTTLRWVWRNDGAPPFPLRTACDSEVSNTTATVQSAP